MSDELNAWEQWKKNLGDTRPWDLLNKEVARVTEDVEKERYSLCKTCPEFLKFTGQCKKCGCFMTGKVKLAGATCPIGKW